MRMDKSLILDCVKRSRWKRTNDSLADLATWIFSVTATRAVSMECSTLKLDRLRSWRLFWVRQGQLVVDSAFKIFKKK